MTENPPPPSGTPEGGGSTPPPPQNPYGSEPSAPPPPPPNPYASQPPPPAEPYAGNPPTAGQTPYGAAPQRARAHRPEPVRRRGLPRLTRRASPGGRGAARRPRHPVPRPADRRPDLRRSLGDHRRSRSTRWIGQLIASILYLGYYVYMESSRGRTFGKQCAEADGCTAPRAATRRWRRPSAATPGYLLSIVGALPLLVISFLSGLASSSSRSSRSPSPSTATRSSAAGTTSSPTPASPRKADADSLVELSRPSDLG